MSMQGVQGEEKIDLTKAEAKRVRERSLRLLFSLIAPVKNRLWGSLVLVVSSQALRVVGPYLIAVAIDQALPQAIKGNWTPLYVTVGEYLGAAISAALLIAFFLRYAQKVNQDIMFDMRRRLFRHTQNLSIEFHETYTSGRIIARQTSDLDSIKELLDSGGNEMVAGILNMIFTAIALLLLDAQSFFILLVALILDDLVPAPNSHQLSQDPRGICQVDCLFR